MRGMIGVPAVALGMALIAAPSGVGATSTRPTLYFLGSSGGTLVPVVRVGAPKAPRAVLVALVAGPNAAEEAAGDESAFPAATRFSGVDFAGSVATVDFGGSGLAVLRTIPRLRVIGSVTYTLTSFPTIKTVRFTLNGGRWGVYDHAGRIIRDYRRGTLAHPWLRACAPGDGCFAP
jgi:spore germination protein GerM